MLSISLCESQTTFGPPMVNFDVKKVLVCRLSIGLYFSESKLGHFFFFFLGGGGGLGGF